MGLLKLRLQGWEDLKRQRKRGRVSRQMTEYVHKFGGRKYS